MILPSKILLNDGEGVFELHSKVAESYCSGSGCLISDLNADGNLDVVTYGVGVRVQHGSGDGTFLDPVVIVERQLGWAGAGSFDEIHVADVDGDGRSDILTGVEFVVQVGSIPPRIAFSTESGFEVFQLAESWPMPAPVDVVGDARAEFVLQDESGLSLTRQIQPMSLSHEFLDRPNLARDFIDADADGVPKVVLAHETKLTVLEFGGESAGTIETDVDFDTPIRRVRALTQLKQLDRNPVLLVLAEPMDSEATDILISIRSGQDGWNAETYPLAGQVVECRDSIELGCSVLTEDLNQDGFEDMVLTLQDEARFIVSYTNTGTELTPAQITSFTTNPQPRLVDMNGDGLVDVVYNTVVGAEDLWHVAFNVQSGGAGGWSVSDPVPSNGGWPITQDVNGDGILDFVERNYSSDELLISVMMPDGSWDIWPPRTWGALVDLNSDGIVDLVEREDGVVRVSLRNGDGTLGEVASTPGYLTGTADFDGDGDLELLLIILTNDRRDRQTAVFAYDAISATWTASVIHEFSGNGIFHRIVDFDDDGVLDVMLEPHRCHETDCSQTFVLRNDGSGQFTLQSIATRVDPDAEIRTELDLDGDGEAELVTHVDTRGALGHSKVYARVRGTWELRSSIQESRNYDWGELEYRTADVDGDGQLDLLYDKLPYVYTLPYYRVRFGEGNLQFGPLHPLIGGRVAGDRLVIDESPNGGAVTVLTRDSESLAWETIMLGKRDAEVDRIEIFDVDRDGDQDVVMLSERGITMVLRTELGDFNNDNLVDAQDIDLLFANLGSRSRDALERFDLNHDNRIDQRDIDFWVVHSASTRRGDTNLDGSVDFDDFIELAAKFGQTGASWSNGDFDGDGKTSFADFLVLSANHGFDREAGP